MIFNLLTQDGKERDVIGGQRSLCSKFYANKEDIYLHIFGLLFYRFSALNTSQNSLTNDVIAIVIRCQQHGLNILRGHSPFKTKKNGESCDFPKTCLSNAKFIVESKSEEIIMIGLIRFEI